MEAMTAKRKAELRAYKTSWQREDRHTFAIILGIRVRTNLMEWLLRPIGEL